MLESLRSIVQEVNAARDFRAVLDIIVSQVKASMDTGICSVYLRDAKQQDFVLMATRGLNPDSVGQVRLKAGEGLVGMVARKAEPINLEYADQHPNYAYFPETGEKAFNAFLGAPIIHHRKVMGVLIVQRSDRKPFDEGEEAFLVTVSAQLAGVIAHADATGELARLTTLKQPGDVDELIFTGVPSAPGVAIGTAVVIAPASNLNAVPLRYSADIEGQEKLFRAALKATKKDMKDLGNGLVDKLNEEERALFDVYIRMLDDKSLGGEVIEKIKEGFTAQSAWSQVVLDHVSRFERMEDAYLRERAADVKDLGRRVLGYLQKSGGSAPEYPDNMVLVGEELSATTFADVPLEKVAAMVSVKGSSNSHMAILGRAIGIPTVMGAVDLPWNELDGRELIVDGHRGHVVMSPTEQLISLYRAQLEEERLLAEDLKTLQDAPCITMDNCTVALWVNTGLRLDAKLSLDRGAEGVGLYRTEIPFLMHDRFPSEEEQRKVYREQLAMFNPRPVTMRTLDIGGDKDLPYFPIDEANPFLGWRGIRVTLDHPEIFLLQVRAMLRASEGLNNLRIMLPMISNLHELESAKALVDQAYGELTEEEGLVLVKPKIGAMIEVPAAVYQAEEIAAKVDFLSVGTNDLTQYLLAVDRNNPRVAELYHSFHPSLLRALKMVVEGAGRAGKSVSVCGEMAGDPVGAVLLVALGFRILSMSANNLLRVKAILRQVSVAEVQALLSEIVKLEDAVMVKAYLEKSISTPEIDRLVRPAAVH